MLEALALQTAADSLQQISETTSGERRQRASAVALVLRAIEQTLGRGAEAGFARRRAEQEVERIAGGAERALLTRLLLLSEVVAESGAGCLCDALVDFAYELESTRRLPEADAVLTLARSIDGQSAAVALHAGRVARKQGDRERALELYRAARELDGSGGAIARLAQIGVAVVSPDAERDLGRVIRGAVCAADHEAAAVGLEERARLRRARGARRAAARDLCFAAARFTDPVDRARVAHQLADLFIAGDDPRAAREALLLALAVGDASQRDHARGRLHTVSRDLGDQVGMRRWRTFSRPALVSLSARPRTPVERSEAPRLARWRERVVQG
jgi:tetratricopeptide (TPR) repeat protein